MVSESLAPPSTSWINSENSRISVSRRGAAYQRSKILINQSAKGALSSGSRPGGAAVQLP